MRLAIFAASIWFLQAVLASAGEASVSDGIFRFEGETALEKLNLADGLASSGKPCSFTRQESDGTVTRVVVFSDKLATHLASMQMPGVMLTFKFPDVPPGWSLENDVERNQIATIYGKDIGHFGTGIYIIRKEDQTGKAGRPLAMWSFGNRTWCP
jgi:hypothetical protein